MFQLVLDGYPQSYSLRSCLVGMILTDRVGATDAELSRWLYVLICRWMMEFRKIVSSFAMRRLLLAGEWPHSELQGLIRVHLRLI